MVAATSRKLGYFPEHNNDRYHLAIKIKDWLL